ncbi:MAG: anti-sigma F factor [Clostridium sp.]|nr:anti-sigma F factor [Clostridium sp.]MCM1399279.1 anti-sigma F factor [Clostridium sp.]MCM1459767.1 anti-sigma F factor [Bacteroides sp.]
MNNTNEMMVEFSGIAQNESFARMVVAAFITKTNPTLEEVSDIKTAVSEAVTNSIIHGYEETVGKIRITAKIEKRTVFIEVKDEGKGIRDIKQAMEPMYTSKPEDDRSGMGFSFMEAFMDKLAVESEMGKGTVVRMWKEIGVSKHQYD